MTLSAGFRLGIYDIVAPIGAGGMGEVYRAHDTTLGRDVAIKALPPAFANDPDRLARFRREAHLLASLNHPNIAQIYGVAESGLTRALVLELVDGPTLAHRIATGPIPLSEALVIARQIADALETAHEAGVIHRDLKPANVKVRDDGTVKVLDFGLAKAMEPPVTAEDELASPTITARATELGVVLGTAAYMAPEQAKGKPVDRRADVWAFGVVLYEMLTGRRLFDAPDVSETLAAVLTREPDWQQLPLATPPSVRRLLARCLARDRRARLDSMASARLDLEETIAARALDSSLSGSVAPHPGDVVATPRGTRSTARVAAMVVAAAAIGAIAMWLATSLAGVAVARPMFASVMPPREATSAFHSGFAMSPDGQAIVVSAKSPDGVRSLWRRRLAEPGFERIAGSEEGLYPFWSFDGKEIGFQAAGFLKRVPAGGGPVQVVCRLGLTGFTASWGKTGDIILSAVGEIYSVPATGGTPQKLPFGTGVQAPLWIDGGPALLYLRQPSETGQAAELWVGTADNSRAPQRVIGTLDRRDPGFRLVGGHVLVFNRAGVLMAQQYDPSSFRISGTAVGLGTAAGTPRGWFAASGGADSLIYMSGDTSLTGGNPGDPVSRLTWVNRRGETTGYVGTPGRYWTMRLSPDGNRVLVNPDKDLWIIDARTGIRTRFTSTPNITYPGGVWSRDGRDVMFREPTGVWIRGADAESKGREVFTFDGPAFLPLDWSADRSFLLTTGRLSRSALSSLDIAVITLANKSVRPLLASEFQELQPRLSHNGRWFAYVSDFSGRQEIYVKPLEGDGAPIRISVDGGDHPQWRGDDRELFYLTPTDEMIAVDLSQLEVTRAPGAQQKLFRRVVNDVIRNYYSPFDVTADGQRLLMNLPEPSEPLVLIQNLSALLGRR